MSLPRRLQRPLVAALSVLPVLALLFTVSWLWAEHRLRMELDRVIATREADGWVVRRGTYTRGGWPFRAVLDTEDVSVSGGGGIVPGGLAWHTPTLRLSVPVVLHPRGIMVTARGEQRWHFLYLPKVTWQAASLATSIRAPWTTGPRGTATGSVVAFGLVASIPNHQSLRIGRLALIFDGSLVSPFWFTVYASDIVLPLNDVWPHGAALKDIDSNVELDGPVPRPGDSLGTWATRWRDAGGQLILHNLQLAWSGRDMLTMSGHAILALDRSMQPEGTTDFAVFGWQEAIDNLSKDGLISNEVANKARSALWGRPLNSSGGNLAGMALSLQDRTLSLASVPLFRIPALTWPAPPEAK